MGRGEEVAAARARSWKAAADTEYFWPVDEDVDGGGMKEEAGDASAAHASPG